MLEKYRVSFYAIDCPIRKYNFTVKSVIAPISQVKLMP